MKQTLLPPSTGGKYPHAIMIIDTETNTTPDETGVIHFTFRVGCGIMYNLTDRGTVADRKTFQYETVNDFAERVFEELDPERKTYIFGHNIGFDLRVIDFPARAVKKGFKLDLPIINGRTFVLDGKSGSRSFSIIDTANLGVTSVKSLGSNVGTQKLSIDFDTATNQELMVYCLRDCEVLETFINEYIQFLRENKLGGFSVTIAGQSLKTFRTRFYNGDVLLHRDPTVNRLERDGYHGGRVECFQVGTLPNQPYYYLDVNSMYPYVMKMNPYPLKLLSYQVNVPVSWLRARLYRKFLTARVEIKTAVPAFPLYRENKLIFPIGTFTTVLTGNELTRAITGGNILRCLEVATYEPGEMFSGYVDFFYDIKLNAVSRNRPTWRYIAKLFLNALYGKFGQTGIIKKSIGTCDPGLIFRLPIVNAQTGKHYDEIAWAGNVYRITREGESTYSIPAIASGVTANARNALLDFILVAGFDNVFYCDTDSLIVNQDGYDRLSHSIDNNKLGWLKLEKQSRDCTIRGLKDYVFDGESKVKGVPKTAKQIDVNSWQYLQFQSFTTWINSGGNSAPIGTPMTKRRISPYSKGIVTESGRVKPFEL